MLPGQPIDLWRRNELSLFHGPKAFTHRPAYRQTSVTSHDGVNSLLPALMLSLSSRLL
jgi:hypothetical protein